MKFGSPTYVSWSLRQSNTENNREFDNRIHQHVRISILSNLHAFMNPILEVGVFIPAHTVVRSVASSVWDFVYSKIKDFKDS